MAMAAYRSSDEEEDGDVWEDALRTKVEQVQCILGFFNPFGNGGVHPDDQAELDLFMRHASRAATRRKVMVLTELTNFLAGKPSTELLADRAYLPDESQVSTESQLDREHYEDLECERTPEVGVSVLRSGERQLTTADSLQRLRKRLGTFGSPLVQSSASLVTPPPARDQTRYDGALVGQATQMEDVPMASSERRGHRPDMEKLQSSHPDRSACNGAGQLPPESRWLDEAGDCMCA
uniref:Uncharacterized protein n=1 Tax=Coccolithus braarudii TaxID=221442 RepID=A0A7S0Q570_9EUKA|mmetsp:Transcript_49222/g.105107  ORF Transcript_49222/g.105107 Transcript_49222/m.105107 type:complete len:236 (+) Transcript_49222:158-865(+)